MSSPEHGSFICTRMSTSYVRWRKSLTVIEFQKASNSEQFNCLRFEFFNNIFLQMTTNYFFNSLTI